MKAATGERPGGGRARRGRGAASRLGQRLVLVAVRRKTLSLLASGLALGAPLAGSALAAGGELDASFGGDGRVRTNFTPWSDAAKAVAIQADGKIVTVGDSKVARLNPDGTLDQSFGSGGRPSRPAFSCCSCCSPFS